MSIDITVAIPTYNGEARLPRVLDALRSQQHTDSFSWEVVVIDNNSTDNTAQVVRTYQQTWPSTYPLSYAIESQQGLAFARQRAVQVANGDLVAFVDDDNLPAADWLQQVYDFAQRHPHAGAFSGQIHGEFETSPPAGFEAIAPYLAIREHGEVPFRFHPERLQLPPGAGLVVRKQAWCESVPPSLKLIGRVGKQYLAGEDYEALLYLHHQGWEIWYNPAMHLAHLVPQYRLERDYLLPLAYGIGLATCHLRTIGAGPTTIPIIVTRTLLGNLRRLAMHVGKHGPQVNTDLLPAFKLRFFWGSFISPWIYWQGSRKS